MVKRLYIYKRVKILVKTLYICKMAKMVNRLFTYTISIFDLGILYLCAQWGSNVFPPLENVDECTVYFLREYGTSRVKVGFTNNLLHRTRTHQCGNAGMLIVEYKHKTKHYRTLEKNIKNDLARFRIRGEWFNLERNIDYAQIVKRNTNVDVDIETN
jgi:hypothetical protein